MVAAGTPAGRTRVFVSAQTRGGPRNPRDSRSAALTNSLPPPALIPPGYGGGYQQGGGGYQQGGARP
jgi:hypothetical protein